MSSLRTDGRRASRRLVGFAGSLLLASAIARSALAATVDPGVLAAAQRDGSADVLLVLADQARPALMPLRGNADYRARRRALVAALAARADHDQFALRNWLDARGIAHRDFWIVNVIAARVPVQFVGALAQRSELARIDANTRVPLRLPPNDPVDASAPAAMTASGIAWGVAKIDAPLVWAGGVTGQDVVIGGEDTGYQWNHPALIGHYRGWNGVSADHDYNWHDAIHNSTGNPCGNDSPFPCDDHGHGTHTAGTFAGNDGAGHVIGVAPGAKWIGCRNMDRGAGTPARYIECMQWMLAPTDLVGANPDPDLAPDVVSNSWACDVAEGCTSGNEIAAAVSALVDGGVFYVAAAQNSGLSGCATIFDAPATYDASFDVGATDANDALAYFSSRGPVTGSALIRPDVSAPGVAIYSSYPPNDYQTLQGTSMAAPHVAGAVALLLSSHPALKGHPDKIAALLRATAVTQGVTNTMGVTQSCGGTPITQWPNNMVGYGRVDAWNAVYEVIFDDDFEH